MRNSPILDFELDQSSIKFVGRDLQRPECILAERDGTIWSADARGGVVRIDPDGAQQVIAQRQSEQFEESSSEAKRYLEGALPTGLAFARNGDLLIANFGLDCLQIMSRDGTSRVLADSINGVPVGKVNFVLRDSRGRIWITISTRLKNWMHALRPDLDDGYIAVYERGALRIAADGFHFTNEIRFDATKEYLYVAETTGGCISRLRVADKGELRDHEVFGPAKLGVGVWPDGIAFDSYRNLWGTLVYSDKLFVLTPQGEFRVLLNEGDPLRVAELEEAFLQGRVNEDVLFATGRGIAPWMSSVTFGGLDLRIVYIGSLKGQRIPCFRSPVAGLPMVHWEEAVSRRTNASFQ